MERKTWSTIKNEKLVFYLPDKYPEWVFVHSKLGIDHFMVGYPYPYNWWCFIFLNWFYLEIYFPSEISKMRSKKQDSVCQVTNLKMKQFGETFLAAFPLVYLLTNWKKKGKGDIWMPTSLAIWILVLHKTFTFSRKGLLIWLQQLEKGCHIKVDRRS